MEWFRPIAFYSDKRALAFKDASDAEICTIRLVIDRIARSGDDDMGSSDALAIDPFGRSKSSSCSVDSDIDMNMAVGELCSLGDATRSYGLLL